MGKSQTGYGSLTGYAWDKGSAFKSSSSWKLPVVVCGYSKSITETEPKPGINSFISKDTYSKDTLKRGRFETYIFKLA